MITGSNTTDKEFEEYIPAAGNASAEGKVSMQDVIRNLKERQKNVANGGINCIPLPFNRFRSEIPGIEQEQYIVLTASTKAGKTQLGSYVYLYSVLDYAFTHRDQCSVHIIYFNLEESESRIKERYISHLLNKYGSMRVSPSNLRSTSADDPLPDEAFDKMNEPAIAERLAFFDECIQFESEDTNPTGILRVCEEYAKSVGDYQTVTRHSRGDGRPVEVFRSYTPHDKKHYKMVFIDHIGLVDLERGMNLKQSMDKMSEYAVKYLRNRYGYTVVAIQQQAMESEGLEAIKMKKMLPAVATLGDTKYTARDANLVLGLFDPSNFGLPNWLGYKIQDAGGDGLRNYGRFLYVLRGRDGEMGGVCPLFFDGATCDFKELPRPDDINEMNKIYAKVKDLKTRKQQKKTQSLLFTLFNGRKRKRL